MLDPEEIARRQGTKANGFPAPISKQTLVDNFACFGLYPSGKDLELIEAAHYWYEFGEPMTLNNQGLTIRPQIAHDNPNDSEWGDYEPAKMREGATIKAGFRPLTDGERTAYHAILRFCPLRDSEIRREIRDKNVRALADTVNTICRKYPLGTEAWHYYARIYGGDHRDAGRHNYALLSTFVEHFYRASDDGVFPRRHPMDTSHYHMSNYGHSQVVDDNGDPIRPNVSYPHGNGEFLRADTRANIKNLYWSAWGPSSFPSTAPPSSSSWHRHNQQAQAADEEDSIEEQYGRRDGDEDDSSL